jgi:hypothetical protein
MINMHSLGGGYPYGGYGGYGGYPMMGGYGGYPMGGYGGYPMGGFGGGLGSLLGMFMGKKK